MVNTQGQKDTLLPDMICIDNVAIHNYEVQLHAHTENRILHLYFAYLVDYSLK